MRILIADRHPVPRSGIAALVRRVTEGAEVQEFDTLQLALAAAAERPPDLMLCGGSTGAAEGPDWIASTAAAIRPAKLVVVSGTVDVRQCHRAHDSGAWGHLPLTSSADVIAAALRLIIAGGAYFPAVNPGVLGDRRPADPGGDRQGLSPRQRQVLAEIEQGRSNKEIADKFGLSVATVKLHVQAIFKTLGAKNRTEAVRRARDLDLIA